MESEARILAFVAGGVSLGALAGFLRGLDAIPGAFSTKSVAKIQAEAEWRIAQKSPPRRAAEVFVNPRAPNDVHRPLRCEDVERRQPLTGCAEATSTDRPRHVGDGRA